MFSPPILRFAYNTILTTIRILERKGYVEHSKDGRAHVYSPLVAEEEASRSEIRHLVEPLLPQLPRRFGAQYSGGPWH